jgi:hypothetical protein
MGFDTLAAHETETIWNITVVDSGTLNGQTFTEIENLIGGLGRDDFVFSDGAGVSGSIDGAGGTNTLDFSAYTAGVTVRLGTGPGRATNIHGVTGSASVDTLIGPDTDSIWNLTGTYAGVVGAAAFTGIENLVGGLGRDDFIFANGAGVRGSIEGGGGSNTIETTPGANDRATLWSITGVDSGSLRKVGFTGIQNLVGAPDNADTFVIGASGGLSGSLDGGVGGFDSLILEPAFVAMVSYKATGPHSGTVDRDGAMIRYFGLEPITDNMDAAARVFTFSNTPQTIRIADNRDLSDGMIVVDSTDSESVTFTNPTDSLTITAGTGPSKEATPRPTPTRSGSTATTTSR